MSLTIPAPGLSRMKKSDIDTFHWRIEESHTHLRATRARLCLANPAMLHSVQFFPPNCSINAADAMPTHAKQLEETVLPFVGSVESVDQKVHAELVEREFEHALLSVQLITGASSRKAELIMQQIIRYKILESLTWSTGEIYKAPMQLPRELRVDRADQLEEYVDLGLNRWMETVESFCAAFSNESVAMPKPQPLSSDKVTASLVQKIQQSENSRHHSTVISNMCGAALGLRGLILTFTMNYEKLGKAYYSSKASGYTTPSEGVQQDGPMTSGASVTELVSTLMSINKKVVSKQNRNYRDINGNDGLEDDWAQSFFGGRSDFHVLRSIYISAVVSPIILLSEKHLVTRRRTTIPLYALYNGLFESWGAWTPFRILVIRDLWGALWRLAREGGEHCHSILLQLAERWNDIRYPDRYPDPRIDVVIEADAKRVAMFSTHASLANHFAVSLTTVFSQFQGVRKTRRQREQMESDGIHALDGNSVTKMSEVWALWESNFIQAKITPVVPVPQVRRVILHKWAWNQRAASCPPLHRSFRRQLLKPLDHTYVFPEAPRIRERYTFHPFTDEERSFLLPYRHPKKDISTKPDRPAASRRVLQRIPEPIATSLCKTTPTISRQVQINPAPEATSVVEAPALPKVKAKKSGGGGGGGGGGGRSYPKRRANVTPGAVSSIINPIDDSESSSPAPDVKYEPPVVLPHRIWDVVDVDIGTHEANTLLGGVNVVLGTKDIPINMLLQFYSGMKTDLTRTLAILHAVARGVSWEGYEADLRKMEFDLCESVTYEIKLVSHENWDNNPIKEQRHTFSLNNVQVVGAPSIAVLPNVCSLTSIEELSLVMDLDKPLLCQDHTLARPTGEGLEYRNRKSSIASFLSIADSNRAAIEEGHPQTSTVLSFWKSVQYEDFRPN
ncbi:hypothetical protein SCHPADRAFT_891149 [Schizopora paradoxa]|uniref:Uncharacterized protein n=1 Tax=Schizopora paradoxa TaxID=27342 RepID=A0A0H2RJ00_9AGAM|nr:hypothetical protein SCHPADRAFT_891149 [Schizopora paradoxa]